MSFPPCFDSQQQYNAWHRSAVDSREICTPCTDCDAKYRAEMTEQARCFKPQVSHMFAVTWDRTTAPKA